MENQILSSQQPIQPQIPIQAHLNNRQSPSVVPHHTSKWIVIAFLIFFPPAAWYFMWREKQYHSWYSIVILIYAIISLITIALMLLFVIPQLTKLYENLNIENPNAPFIYPAAVTVIIISIAQIIFALYIRKRVKQYEQLSKNLLIITTVLLALNYLITSLGTAAMNLSVITPIYTMVSAF